MSYTDINAGKRRIDLSHPLAIPTETVERDLRARFPGLEFPYVKQDHVAGVQSNVHAWCEKHQMFTRMSLASARRTLGTKYGCFACANENKGGEGGEGGEGGWHYSAKQYAPGYIGRAGVQSGIFRALKAAYPDTIWEHRMDNGKEIDVYVPSLQFGIEYNGNYYHSTAVGKDDKYHVNKTLGAYRESKYVLHVFTDEVSDDFSKYVDYAKCFDNLSKLNYKVMSNHDLARALTPVTCKAKQVSSELGRQFVRQNSLTFMSESVLSFMTLYVGLYVGQELRGVLYGKSGSVFGVVLANYAIDLDIRVGLQKYAQFAKTLTYFAPLRCPVQVGLHSLYGLMLGLEKHLGLSGADMYGDRLSYELPQSYGLRADNTIDVSTEGQPYIIYDCGWVAVRWR